MIIKALKNTNLQGLKIQIDNEYNAQKVDTYKYLVEGVLITRDDFVETFEIVNPIDKIIMSEEIQPIERTVTLDGEVVYEKIGEEVIVDKLTPSETTEPISEDSREVLGTEVEAPVENLDDVAQNIINQNELQTETTPQTESTVEETVETGEADLKVEKPEIEGTIEEVK